MVINEITRKDPIDRFKENLEASTFENQGFEEIDDLNRSESVNAQN